MQIHELWTTTYDFWTKIGDFGRFREILCIVGYNSSKSYILDSKSYRRILQHKDLMGLLWNIGIALMEI